jgi:hypothetical protein
MEQIIDLPLDWNDHPEERRAIRIGTIDHGPIHCQILQYYDEDDWMMAEDLGQGVLRPEDGDIQHIHADWGAYRWFRPAEDAYELYKEFVTYLPPEEARKEASAYVMHTYTRWDTLGNHWNYLYLKARVLLVERDEDGDIVNEPEELAEVNGGTFESDCGQDEIDGIALEALDEALIDARKYCTENMLLLDQTSLTDLTDAITFIFAQRRKEHERAQKRQEPVAVSTYVPPVEIPPYIPLDKQEYYSRYCLLCDENFEEHPYELRCCEDCRAYTLDLARNAGRDFYQNAIGRYGDNLCGGDEGCFQRIGILVTEGDLYRMKVTRCELCERWADDQQAGETLALALTEATGKAYGQFIDVDGFIIVKVVPDEG